MLRRSFFLTSALLLGSFAVSFAQSTDLKIVGSGDGMEMLQAVAVEFAAANPGKTVTVPPSIGTGGGITAVGTEKEIMGRIARNLTEAEKAQGLVATPLVRVPVGVFVHPSTGVTQLTSAQTVDVFLGKIRNWNEVGGRDLTVRIVRREPSDSTFVTLRGSVPGWQDLVIADRSKLALTTGEMFDTVRTTEGTVGFGPFAKQLEKEVIYLKIDGKFPTDPDYKSTSTLSLLHKTSTVTGDAKAFIAFAGTAKAKDVMKNLGGLVQ
jgi:phosphate transport system substrate-binding protein